MGEFELIRHCFSRPELQPSRRDVIMGIGDDCALISVPPGKQMAVSVDTSTAGVHFLPSASAHSIGWRALAVSLSDLAAMGAQPAWFTLAASLPDADPDWLANFSRGLSDLARPYQLALVGGDTTKGALSFSVQVHGYVSPGAAWCRQGARPGDIIYVSGPLGGAAVGLQVARRWLNDARPFPEKPPVIPIDGHPDAFDLMALKAYCYPVPRFDLVSVLSSRIHCAIDVSDGLLADLGHILTASRVGAQLDIKRIPVHPACRALLSPDDALQSALNGGDDYELCFTVSPKRRLEVEISAEQRGTRLYPIGVVTAQPGIRGIDWAVQGFDHFRGTTL